MEADSQINPSPRSPLTTSPRSPLISGKKQQSLKSLEVEDTKLLVPPALHSTHLFSSSKAHAVVCVLLLGVLAFSPITELWRGNLPWLSTETVDGGQALLLGAGSENEQAIMLREGQMEQRLFVEREMAEEIAAASAGISPQAQPPP